MATRTPLATAVGRRRLPPLWVVRGVMAMRAALRRWADALVPTDVLLMEHAGVFGKPILLRLVTEMQIPDILAERGPMTAAEIARLADVQPDMLHRALRFLCTFDVFKLDGQGRFSNTRLSSELTKGAVMRNAVLLLGGELNFQLWDNLEDTVRTGADAFSRRRGSPWEWFTAHPDDGERFVHGMASLTAMEAAFIAGSYPYGQFRVVCDVGGGSGVLLASILARCPDTRAILVDRAS
ncbi:MAG TPA: methyltransferase, partial [Candidatus Methylomirabilis sp.]|nr:methyltransferase [Candidatus Methylomirabilis sp.]